MNPFLKELFKGNIGSALKVATNVVSLNPGPIPIDPSRYTTPDGGPGWMFEVGGSQYSYFKYTEYADGVTAYNQCPPLASILNAKAQALNNGKTWILDNKSNEVSDSKEAGIIRELIRRPNPIQSWKQFEAQLSIFVDLFGFGLILPIKPAGFGMLDATSLWNIPASWIDVQLTMERFSHTGGVTLSEIVINFGGTRTVFKLKNLIIIRGSVPSFNTLTFPGSKIVSLAMPINNIIGALESRNTLINFRGAQGILAQDPGKGQYVPIAITDPEKEKLQQDFRRYGLRKKQFSVIITTAALKWQQMGYATKDLMLMEEVQESSLLICNGYNYPPFLQGLKDSTYNNQRSAMKGLYENCVIPDAENIYEQLSDAFGLEEYGIRIDKDFAHIPAMQEDKKEAADARKALNDALAIEWKTGLITLDEWRVKLDEDPLPNGRGKLYYDEYVQQYGGGQPAPVEQPKTNVNINVKYDPNQPRDNQGQWTDGSSSGFSKEDAEDFLKDSFLDSNGLDVGKVEFDDNLSPQQLELRAKHVNKLLYEYKITNIERISELSFKSKANEYAGRVFGTPGNAVSVNFGSETALENDRLLNLNSSNIRRKSAVDKANLHLATTTHEFAHLTTRQLRGLAISTQRGFWKDIEVSFTSYRDEITPIMTGRNGLNKVQSLHLGKYASTSLDEYVAEGFAEYKLSSNPSKYAKEVGRLFDKYFKR